VWWPFGVHSPAADELRDLSLQGPAAVLVIRHVVYDTDDVALEFAEAVYPPGQWTAEQEYEYRIER
jgi:hypothetical protein